MMSFDFVLKLLNEQRLSIEVVKDRELRDGV